MMDELAEYRASQARSIVQQLPQALNQLIAQLRAVPPTIQEVDFQGPDQGGDYFRMDPPAALLADEDAAAAAGGLWCPKVRLWVLGLIGSCPSLRVVDLHNCGISRELEVERLCQGLKSNKLLERLNVGGNLGVGSSFGCQQMSHILGPSGCTSLKQLCVARVGLKAAGLSQLLSNLLANTGSGLQTLYLENNPECLADERAAGLLAQLVSNLGKRLREIGIRGTGLAVAGAALLSAALAAHDGEEPALQKLCVGGPEPILNALVSSLGRCSELCLLFSEEKDEAGQLAEPLAQLLRTHTSLETLRLDGGHFSTQAWRCIFQALCAKLGLSVLSLQGSTTLDHNVKDDLHQLLAGNPGLTIQEIVHSPSKGSRTNVESTGFFYCTCASCCDSMHTVLTEVGEGGGTLNVEQLPKELRPLVAALAAVPPSIEEVDLDGPDYAAVGDMFRLEPPPGSDGMLWELRLLVLGLIGRCPSLRTVKLSDCNISRESEVERLCQGLKSNTVLRHLLADNNPGFGSEFGCQQVSYILALSCSTSQLQTLEMWAVGMKGTGLSLLLGTLLANDQSQLQILDVGGNPECLADNDQGSSAAAELLAQLLSSTACPLRELYVNGTGLSVAGATRDRLSAALDQNTSLFIFREERQTCNICNECSTGP